MNKAVTALAGLMLFSFVLAGCGGQQHVHLNVSGTKPDASSMNKTSNRSTSQPGNSTTKSTNNATTGGEQPGGGSVTTANNTTTGNTTLGNTTVGNTTKQGGGAPSQPAQPGSGAGQTGSEGALLKLHPGQLSGVAVGRGNTVDVSTSTGIYESVDGGRSWRQVVQSSRSVLGIGDSATGDEVAWTASQVFVRSPGGTFRSLAVHLASGSALNLQQASVGTDGAIWVVAGGHVYTVSSDGVATQQVLPISVIALDAVDASTSYAVGADDAIYKTTDGGQQWTQVFWPPLNEQLPWTVQIQVNGSHVAVLYSGGDASVGSVAYILCTSNDHGQTWQPFMDEPSFPHDYGDPKPLVQQSVFTQPAAFTLQSSGDVVFVGANAQGDAVTADISQVGRVQWSNAMSSGQPFDFSSSTEVAASANGQSLYVAGSNNGHAMFERSTDGGLTWHQD